MLTDIERNFKLIDVNDNENLEPAIKVECEVPNLVDYSDNIEACRLVFKEYVKTKQENTFAGSKQTDENLNSSVDKITTKINGVLENTGGFMSQEKNLSESEDQIPFDSSLM